MMLPLRLFSRQWLFATALAVLAVATMIRLGFWQLDRLATRRAFNERALMWVDGPELWLDSQSLALDLYNMEYRPVSATGEYSFGDQVALKNQQNGTQLGVALMTPLRIVGAEESVLVLRGWIPQADADRSAWDGYNEPGMVIVRGVLRRSQSHADFGNLTDPTLMPGQTRLDLWYSANVERISEQSEVSIRRDVYVQLIPDSETVFAPPVPLPLELEISEGSHMSYAIQWFSFATILAVGYPIYVARQSEASKREKTPEEASGR